MHGSGFHAMSWGGMRTAATHRLSTVQMAQSPHRQENGQPHSVAQTFGYRWRNQTGITAFHVMCATVEYPKNILLETSNFQSRCYFDFPQQFMWQGSPANSPTVSLRLSDMNGA